MFLKNAKMCGIIPNSKAQTVSFSRLRSDHDLAPGARIPSRTKYYISPFYTLNEDEIVRDSKHIIMDNMSIFC